MESNASSLNTSRATLLAKQIKWEWWWVTIGLVVFCAVLSFYREEINLKRLDLTFYDFQSTHFPTLNLKPPPETVLIIIDDDSIIRVGYWPWRRIEYARVLDYLGQAKAVGLDVFFNDKNPAYPSDDDYLAYAIESHGRVALPSVFIADDLPSLPITPLREAAAAIGYINVPADADGVIRRTRLYHEVEKSQHFVLALLEAAGESKQREHILKQSQGPFRLVPFRGPSGFFNSYSFADVVEGKVAPNTFKDKYVLIGAWSHGLGDFHPTPLSTEKQPNMAGVEILANNLENTLDDHWIYMLSTWLTILLSSLPIILICIMLRHLRPRRAIMSTIAVLIFLFMGNWLLLNIFNIWVPPTASLIGTILAYPIWYWRSQETVLKYINSEISEMRAQDPALRLALADSSTQNSLPQRLSHLHKAIDLLRKAQHEREETLRFISHDMRSPQNSILALIDMYRNKQLDLNVNQMLDHVENYSYITLNLVDDFINLAKVEAMELHFTPVFLNELIAEICDDAWVRAQAKNITIRVVEPDEGIWVDASSTLLSRAFANLIDNAIKYSSNDTEITCVIENHLKNQQVIITIKDQGWGIPADDLPTIFQAFKRAHSDQKNTPGGSGLGLAFVETVVLRHFGNISVSSKVNEGTTFTIHLPLSTSL